MLKYLKELLIAIVDYLSLVKLRDKLYLKIQIIVDF